MANTYRLNTRLVVVLDRVEVEANSLEEANEKALKMWAGDLLKAGVVKDSDLNLYDDEAIVEDFEKLSVIAYDVTMSKPNCEPITIGSIPLDNLSGSRGCDTINSVVEEAIQNLFDGYEVENIGRIEAKDDAAQETMDLFIRK